MKPPSPSPRRVIFYLYFLICITFFLVVFNRRSESKYNTQHLLDVNHHSKLIQASHLPRSTLFIDETYKETARAASSNIPNVDNKVNYESERKNDVIDSKLQSNVKVSFTDQTDPLHDALDVIRDAISRDVGSFTQTQLYNGNFGKESSYSSATLKLVLDKFSLLQASILAGKSPPRFIVWKVTPKTSGAGLGNRVLGVISALVLAIASNRAFIIADDEILASALEAIPINEGGIDMSLSSARFIVPNFDTAHPLAWGLGMDTKCGCDNYTSPPLSDIVTLTMETTQYLVPCFAHNPSLRPILLAAFGPTTAAFRPLMQRFFRLNGPLRTELARFALELHPPQSINQPRRHVIGLQIRTGHLIRPKSEEATFYRCAQQLGALAQLGRGAVTRDSAYSEINLENALNYLENILLDVKTNTKASQSINIIEVFYFIATDSEKVRQRAKSILGENRVITYSGSGSTAAVIDTWALSLCDDVILTYPKSTFGFVGASLSTSGLPPHVVVSGSKTSSECVRLTSTEPVFHGWFMRWFADCYSREWETGDMLNQDNAYFCLMQPSNSPPTTWGTHVCPASDSADGMLFIQSPFDYEALDELGDGESFFGDAKITRKDLMSRFQEPYRDFVKRTGPQVYGYSNKDGQAIHT
jgi:hypothetical protein